MKYLDANVIIRYLTNDDPEKAERAYAFLQAVEKGEEIVITTGEVIAEAIYVLASKSHYHYPRELIVKKMLPVLQLKGLKLTEKKAYMEALVLYGQKNIDFVDLLIIAKMKHKDIKTLVSFDRDFDDFPFISREEPRQ